MVWASQGVVYPQVLRQDLAHVLQGDIARVVPTTIVDQLEMVYVQDDARQGSGRAQSPFNFEMQHLHHKVGAGHPLAVAYKVPASLRHGPDIALQTRRSQAHPILPFTQRCRWGKVSVA